MKQILLINDVVGHSHVGMVAMLPILTYQGHSVFNLPTALVSNTLDYGHFNVLETTDYMRGTLPVWQQLGFRFDAVCTGLMFSEEQARLVVDYCKKLKDSATQPLSHSATSPTIVFVDPIMGDGGRLYNGMGQRQVELMREMVSVADLTFPNYTEACYLADVPFRQEGLSWEEVCALLDAIVALGARSVVITSAKVDGHSCVVGRRSDKPLSGFPQHHDDGRYFRLDYEEIPLAFHGTGDIFSAVLIGRLMNGEPLRDSTQAAMRVVSSLIDRNRDQKDLYLGIPIEKCLDLL